MSPYSSPYRDTFGNMPAGWHCLKHVPADRLEQEQDTTTQDAERRKKREVLRCKTCGAPITRNSERIVINEQHRHIFTNPHGYIYQIGCFANAPGCVRVGEETNFFSWFPEYSWQVALCGRCFTLLGWAFRSQESFFWGLILDQLQQESDEVKL